MPGIRALPARWRYPLFFVSAALIIVADQLSKIWIRAALDIGEVFFQAGIFSIVRVVPNTGSAFGLFAGHTAVLSVISAVFIVLMLAMLVYFHRRIPSLDRRLVWLALGLIMGGTAGNLIDRLSPHLAGVTDFISVGWWPTFNLADSAITVGAIILAAGVLRGGWQTADD